MKEIIENAWSDRSLLENKETIQAIESVIEQIDKGTLRVAEPSGDEWIVNEWVKKAGCDVLSHSSNGNHRSRPL